MSRKQLRKKVELLLASVKLAVEVPAMIMIQKDGTRVVIGQDSRRLPDDTPAGRGTKVFVGANYDDV
jgi:hypothetical protein